MGGSDFNQFVVALSPRSFVRKERQVWVQFLAKLPYYLRIVKLIVQQKLLWVFVEANIQFTNCVVCCRLGVPLCNTRFQPGLEQAQAVALFYFLD